MPHHHTVQGASSCVQPRPRQNQRVWFQRTLTGSGTIYLMTKRPDQPISHSYAQHAFGWLPESVATEIWLAETSGWCNYWHHLNVVEFTDVTRYVFPAAMTKLSEETNSRRQEQHWLTPAHIARLTGAPSFNLQPETQVPQFDPYRALAEQNARLAQKAPTRVYLEEASCASAPSNFAKGKQVASLRDKCGSAVDTIVTNNKVAAKSAAFLEAGRIANNQAAKLLAKHLPAIARGYADTPLGKLLIANLAVTAVQHFKPNEATLNKVTAAMATQAYAEILKTFNVEGFIDSIMSDKALQSALTAASDD